MRAIVQVRSKDPIMKTGQRILMIGIDDWVEEEAILGVMMRGHLTLTVGAVGGIVATTTSVMFACRPATACCRWSKIVRSEA